MTDTVDMERSDELVVVIPPQQALDVFVGGAASVDPFLADIRLVIERFQPDVSTAKGRAAIASVARKVASAKVRLDDMGKELVAKQKEIPNKIDATRRHIRETLDKWRDEVRQPLTEWERVEKERKDRQTSLLAEAERLAVAGVSWDEINHAMLELLKLQAGDDEQFAGQLALAKERARATLEQRLAAREKYDAEQAELARLQEVERQAQQAARDAKLKQEAVEAAAAEAARKARAEADAAIRKAQEEARAAEARADDERRQREAEKRAAEEFQERQRQTAAAEARAEEARQNDNAHRANVKSQAVAALVAMGIWQPTAERVIEAIDHRQIRYLSINY